jgi:undecaprenyl-diphosphatase
VSHMTYPEAIVVGFIQGVTELFPVSSLGHNVLIPALIGGSWANDLNVATPESPYLAFIVGLHVATAIGIMIYFWRDWIRIISGFFSSVIRREVRTVDQKLAWMLVFATIPVGLVGLAFEHEFRVLFGKPVRAAIFLVINGLILYAGERFRTRKSRQADADIAARHAMEAQASPARTPSLQATGQFAVDTGQFAVDSGQLAVDAAGFPPAAAASVQAPGQRGTDTGGPPVRHASSHASGQRASRLEEIALAEQADERLAAMGYVRGVLIGCTQVLALLAGISRDGVTMVGGMFSGLSREDAARFAFLLATPVILAAGLLKVPDLTGPLGHGIHGQILVGSVLSGIGAYVSVRFLVKYFRTRTLTPFAIYCVVFGLGSIIYLQVK